MKKPDWDFWIELDRMEAWKAVALSLNIEPDSVKFSGIGYLLTPTPSPDTASLFNKRCRLLEANITNEFQIYSMSVFAGSLRAEISLKQFVGWAKYRTWEIPEPIKGLSEPAVPFTLQIISQLLTSQPEDSADDVKLAEFEDTAPPQDATESSAPAEDEDRFPSNQIDAPLLQKPQTFPVRSTPHKLSGRRRVLDVEINEARSRAPSSEDTNSVWAELAKLAEQKFGCLLGFVEGEIKYKDGDKPGFLTKKALGQRLKRKSSPNK